MFRRNLKTVTFISDENQHRILKFPARLEIFRNRVMVFVFLCCLFVCFVGGGLFACFICFLKENIHWSYSEI